MPRLPATLRTLLAELRRPPLRTLADLRDAVAAHLDAVRAAAATTPFVDLGRAEEVAAVLAVLLDAWPELPDDHRLHVQAAARYFTRPHDGEDDFDSIVGFEDDAEVLNHVLARLGRADLSLDLD